LIEKDIKLAKKFGIKVVLNLEDCKFIKEKKNLIPYFFAKKNSILPIDEKNGAIVVAVSNVLDLSSLKEVKLMLEKEIFCVYCPKENLEKAIEKCYYQKQQTKSIFSTYENKEKEIEKKDNIEGYDLLEASEKNPVIHMLNAIIVEAIQQRASDIHFDPTENGLNIRYRIDGVLQKRSSPPKEYASQLITRIKVMSKLDIAEQRMPQDGRIKLKMGRREINFRVSSIPIIYGERIVLRILDRDNIILGLEKIGMSANILHEFKKLISMPEGIILVTGPTGSGKTTTLYSAISEINSPEKNIMTIEDPVEYKLSDIAQIGVNPKINLTFAAGLKHILRQDPDAIMVGEIRDRETAEIAIQSSLTGHLVLSTLHTNNAPSALARLFDMGIESYLLTSSIIGVLAQRLVRKICSNCRVSYLPQEEELKGLGIEGETIEFFKGRGCEKCFNTGYKGRHGIYELMKITSSLKKQIMKTVDVGSIKRSFKEQTKEDLLKSGANLIKKGITTSFEVFRVVKTMEREVF
jgi:general secretion pathway protein E